MKLTNVKGKIIDLTLETSDERTTITYVSEFHLGKKISIEIQPVIKGNDNPILHLRLPFDCRLLVNSEDKNMFAVVPDINTDGWNEIKND